MRDPEVNYYISQDTMIQVIITYPEGRINGDKESMFLVLSKLGKLVHTQRFYSLDKPFCWVVSKTKEIFIELLGKLFLIMKLYLIFSTWSRKCWDLIFSLTPLLVSFGTTAFKTESGSGKYKIKKTLQNTHQSSTNIVTFHPLSSEVDFGSLELGW